MSTRLKRLVLPLARDVKAGKPMGFKHRSAAEQILFLLRKPPRRGTKPAAARKAAKATSHRESTGAIREAVCERAAGVCEGCGRRWGFWRWTMDHFDGGTGKSQRQAVENCWALCGSPSIPGSCHYLRQRNVPDVGVWNRAFALHATKHGYPVIAHIVHASLRPATAAAQTPLGHSGSEAGGKE